MEYVETSPQKVILVGCLHSQHNRNRHYYKCVADFVANVYFYFLHGFFFSFQFHFITSHCNYVLKDESRAKADGKHVLI